MNELTIDGKQYISSKKAADITGYAKDYVGQLCREGHVEARMVGRSWYVLESSIRAHRFGGDVKESAPIEAPIVAEPLDTWEKPTYTAETIPSMPVLPVQQPEEAVSATTAETLTDMQSAWKEWFAQKQDHLIESPEIIDAREEEHEKEVEEESVQEIEEEEELLEAPEPVSIHTIQEEEPVLEEEEEGELEPESEPVLIHHVAPVPMPRVQYYQEEQEEEYIPTKQERKQARAQKARANRKGYLGPIVVRALLLALIGITVAITAISSGLVDRYVHPGTPTQPLFNFLGGTSIYTK